MRVPTVALLAAALGVVGALGVAGAQPSAAAPPPPPVVSDAALAAAVRDLPLDGRVLDLVLTTRSTDRSVSDTVRPGRRTVTLAADVLFAFGRADLTPQAAARLAQVAQSAREGGRTGSVDGYTDAVGDAAANRVLSLRRATAVRDALRRQLPGLVLTVQGHGEADPVAPERKPDGSDDPAGRAANRRVTLTVLG